MYLTVKVQRQPYPMKSQAEARRSRKMSQAGAWRSRRGQTDAWSDWRSVEIVWRDGKDRLFLVWDLDDCKLQPSLVVQVLIVRDPGSLDQTGRCNQLRFPEISSQSLHPPHSNFLPLIHLLPVKDFLLPGHLLPAVKDNQMSLFSSAAIHVLPDLV